MLSKTFQSRAVLATRLRMQVRFAETGLGESVLGSIFGWGSTDSRAFSHAFAAHAFAALESAGARRLADEKLQ